MATLSSLREVMRTQLGDIAKFAKERDFQNEDLNRFLFEAIRAHDHSLTWETLPPEQEVLVVMLAKSRLCLDSATKFSLDPKLSVGGNLSREKLSNAQNLMQLAAQYREEYDWWQTKIDSGDGDFIVTELTRESRTVHAIVPTQLATRPPAATLFSPSYRYSASTRMGFVRFSWKCPLSGNIAYLRVYLSRSSTPSSDDTVLRTIYDLTGDPLNYAFPPAPAAVPSAPQLAGNDFEIQYTISPTGCWYLAICVFNWNGLFTWSPAVKLDVFCYAVLSTDVFTIPDSTETTSTTTTTTTTTTT